MTKLKNDYYLIKLRQYYSKYGIEISDDELKEITEKAKKDAEEHYSKIKPPKISSLKVYKDLWIIQTIDYHFAVLATQQHPTGEALKVANAAKDYFEVIPFDKHDSLEINIHSAQLEERKSVWEDEDLSMNKVESKFKKLTKARADFVKSMKFKNYQEMMAEKYKIPPNKTEDFLDNSDKAIEFCNKHLDNNNLPDLFFSEYNHMCYICKLKEFPLKDMEEAKKLFFSKNPKLKKYQKKINISLGETSQMSYKKQTDTFEVLIDSNSNMRHRILDLFHELAHVKLYINEFDKGNVPILIGRYESEKYALKEEIKILKALDDNLYNAYFGKILHDIASVLFQIEIYKNPDQDYAKLYAKTLNKCWIGAHQNSNPTYILDEYVVFKPLQNLAHAVAGVDVIL